jgi:hypothetical protein
VGPPTGSKVNPTLINGGASSKRFGTEDNKISQETVEDAMQRIMPTF